MNFVKSLALIACVSCGPVYAQSNCATHVEVVETLNGQYGETLQSTALSTKGVVETFANLLSGIWTTVVTEIGGLSCLVASGRAYMIEPQGEDV